MRDKQICNYDGNELLLLRDADRITIILHVKCSSIDTELNIERWNKLGFALI